MQLMLIALDAFSSLTDDVCYAAAERAESAKVAAAAAPKPAVGYGGRPYGPYYQNSVQQRQEQERKQQEVTAGITTCHITLLTALINADGLFKGGSEDEMLRPRLAAAVQRIRAMPRCFPLRSVQLHMVKEMKGAAPGLGALAQHVLMVLALSFKGVGRVVRSILRCVAFGSF